MFVVKVDVIFLFELFVRFDAVVDDGIGLYVVECCYSLPFEIYLR